MQCNVHYTVQYNEVLILAYKDKLGATIMGSNHDHVFVMDYFSCHPGSPTFSERLILLAGNELHIVDIAALPQSSLPILNTTEDQSNDSITLL